MLTTPRPSLTWSFDVEHVAKLLLAYVSHRSASSLVLRNLKTSDSITGEKTKIHSTRLLRREKETMETSAHHMLVGKFSGRGSTTRVPKLRGRKQMQVYVFQNLKRLLFFEPFVNTIMIHKMDRSKGCGRCTHIEVHFLSHWIWLGGNSLHMGDHQFWNTWTWPAWHRGLGQELLKGTLHWVVFPPPDLGPSGVLGTDGS